ncbi:hypothetical protein [Erwinia mallotivora]|uniref:hypothetical protein n=1 Tax=Erwinia mallotivora TaxID=69222 RepID=UPI0021C0E147|nr:hypothetical protein [Erwinia mallotivora]
MAKRKPKFYTESDVESLTNIMQELPDLTPTRLLKNDVLAKVSKVILSLSKDKGYSVNEIHEVITSSGFTDVTLADIKSITERKRTVSNKSGSDAKKKTSVKPENTSQPGNTET